MFRVILHLRVVGICFITIATAIMGRGDAQVSLNIQKPTDSTSHSRNDTIHIPNPNSLHHIQLDYSYSGKDPTASSNALLQYLSTPSAPLSSIHKLSITGEIYDKSTWPNWIQFIALLPQLSLSELHWTIETPIPYEIIRILEQMSPPCRLYYTTSYYHVRHKRMWEEVFGMEKTYPLGLENLVGSPILYSLKTEIGYGRFPNLEFMDRIFRVLSTTPTLRALDLSLYHHGCVMGGGQPYAFDFTSHPNISFAPLESLRLKGYNLDESSDGGKEWRYKDPWDNKDRISWYKSWQRVLPKLIVDGMNEVKMSWKYLVRDYENFRYKPNTDGRTNLECWLEAMDWSKLQSLNLHQPSDATLLKLRGRTLPALRNLEIAGGYKPSTDATLDFVEYTILPLTSLSLRNIYLCCTEGLVSALLKHSQALRSLSVHSLNSWHMPENQTQIMAFAASCPLLRWLEIDIPYPSDVTTIGEYISTTFQPLVSGTKSSREIVLHYPLPYIHQAPKPKRGISDLQLRNLLVEFESMDPEDRQDVLEIDRDLMEALFEYLKGKGGIEKLTIFVGDWKSRNHNDHRTEEFKGKFKKCVCEVRKGCVVDEGRRMYWETED